MGQLFSRALRRFTQGTSNNQTPRQQENDSVTGAQPAQRAEHEYTPTVQQIPVGQSIDSAEFATFEAIQQTKKPTEKGGKNQEPRLDINSENRNPSNDRSAAKSNENTPEVEEAVIKIQAYVRGHLTRKALKDAQQQNATPAPNALGQSQFDEESLMRNPMSAVFSLASPLNEYMNSIRNENQAASGKLTPKLESIAEETQSTRADKNDNLAEEFKRDSGNKLAINQSLTLSVDRKSEERDSASPAPSEANASIDLSCDTPASVSIDIADHNIQPTDKMASVLHFKTSPVQIEDRSLQTEQLSLAAPRVIEPPPFEAPGRKDTPPPSPLAHNALVNSSSHSIDSAEAAAIRIQSAFRGYHTRKHSPYRRRSPHSTSPLIPDDIQMNNGSNSNGAASSPLRQQDATSEHNDFVQTSQSDQRQSRQRQRDESSATEEQSTIMEAQSELDKSLDGVTLTLASDREPSESQANPLQDTSLTNALDDITKSISQDHNQGDGGVPEGMNQMSMSHLPRSSLGAISIDTDSSNLGAALSLNEEVSDSPYERTTTSEASSRKSLNPTEYYQSTDANLVASVADESISSDQASRAKAQEAALSEATEALEAALDSTVDDGAGTGDNQKDAISNEGITFSEEELRAVELDSDDIERRDPRGYVSSELARSAQIKTSQEQSSSEVGGSIDGQGAESVARLTVESPDEAFASGPPSSNGATSSDDAAESDADQKQRQPEGQRQGTSGGGGNKNRRKNRNKKKGKK